MQHPKLFRSHDVSPHYKHVGKVELVSFTNAGDSGQFRSHFFAREFYKGDLHVALDCIRVRYEDAVQGLEEFNDPQYI